MSGTVTETKLPDLTSDELDEELVALARAGDIREFARAMLEHPIHGPLLRAFALEEEAPEYEKMMKRIREKFGARQERIRASE